MNELHLFSGAGGGILGGLLLGHTPVCAVEIEPYCRKVLLQRQRDGILPWFPIWDDVTTFDGNPWRGIADVVCGGFPCQDISIGGKGAGITGKRSGLWSEMLRIICEVQPWFVFIENSPMLTRRGLGTVLGGLAENGFDAEWGVFSAAEVGAPHIRERFFLFGRNTNKVYASGIGEPMESNFLTQKRLSKEKVKEWGVGESELVAVNVMERFSTYPEAVRILHGMADRSNRLAALGNAQVPAVVRKAWHVLCQEIGSKK
jgi:DNA (cytosine-5)-methyltransferase 1